MKKSTHTKIIFVLVFALNFPAVQRLAVADFISTEATLAAESRTAVIGKAQRFISREKVINTMLALGVSSEAVSKRVALLSDEELMSLSEQIDEVPAGAGALEVIGIVFLVLMILEFTGAIDIFKKV